MSESQFSNGTSLAPKLVFSFFLLVVAMVAGYLVVYYWTFNNFGDVLNVNLLKNQIIANQQADEVKNQLKDLGYSFDDTDFHQLNGPSASNYTTDVLGGYEPVPLAEGNPTGQGYYFYNHPEDAPNDPDDEVAYYFMLDENGQVDPESIVPMINH
jgi:hypothetical protein